MGCHLWRLGNDGHVQITQPIPLGLHLGIDIAQQDPAVDAFEFHVIIREVAPDITGGNGAEQRVGDSVQHHIAIGVSQQALLIRHLYPPQRAGPFTAKFVYIKAVADTNHALSSC